MFVTNWNSTTKIQKISEITNFFRHYFLSRTEVFTYLLLIIIFNHFITLFLDACQQLRELVESSCFKNRTLFFRLQI